MTIRAVAAVSTGAMILLAGALPAQGQSPASLSPNAQQGGHYHEGELGEKLMILETAFKCDCGCGLDVHSCQFQMQCDTSPVWSQRIRDSLEKGESVEAIQASFVTDFGVAVLMLPPAEGFNLLGYFLPALAIVTAGMLVGLVVRGGMGKATLVPVGEVTDEDAERLRAAMRTLDKAESPDW
jgi:cytochrome c-type biogenesis protein CcmH/NrfF